MRFGRLRRWAGGVGLRARLLGVTVRPLLAALGVGVAAYFLGPWVAVTSGEVAGGFAVMLAVRMTAALKRLLTRPASIV